MIVDMSSYSVSKPGVRIVKREKTVVHGKNGDVFIFQTIIVYHMLSKRTGCLLRCPRANKALAHPIPYFTCKLADLLPISYLYKTPAQCVTNLPGNAEGPLYLTTV